MANQYAPDYNIHKFRAGSWGNQGICYQGPVNLNGFANGDVVYLMKIPKSTVIYDILASTPNGNAGAGATIGFGIIAAAGGALGDATHFTAAGALALSGGAANVRKTSSKSPVYLNDDDYYLIGTIGGANIGANNCNLDVCLDYEFKGNL